MSQSLDTDEVPYSINWKKHPQHPALMSALSKTLVKPRAWKETIEGILAALPDEDFKNSLFVKGAIASFLNDCRADRMVCYDHDNNLYLVPKG
jgi:hypothetical protein